MWLCKNEQFYSVKHILKRLLTFPFEIFLNLNFLYISKKVEIKMYVVNLYQENLARNFDLIHKNRLLFSENRIFERIELKLVDYHT